MSRIKKGGKKTRVDKHGNLFAILDFNWEQNQSLCTLHGVRGDEFHKNLNLKKNVHYIFYICFKIFTVPYT